MLSKIGHRAGLEPPIPTEISERLGGTPELPPDMLARRGRRNRLVRAATVAAATVTAGVGLFLGGTLYEDASNDADLTIDWRQAEEERWILYNELGALHSEELRERGLLPEEEAEGAKGLADTAQIMRENPPRDRDTFDALARYEAADAEVNALGEQLRD